MKTDNQNGPGLEPMYCSVSAAEDASGHGRTTMYRWAAAGRIRMVKSGGRTLIDVASLRRYLDSLPEFRPAMGASTKAGKLAA
jgi:excisionase family DNA binding protein